MTTTVRDLITHLQQFPEDMPVVIEDELMDGTRSWISVDLRDTRPVQLFIHIHDQLWPMYLDRGTADEADCPYEDDKLFEGLIIQ